MSRFGRPPVTDHTTKAQATKAGHATPYARAAAASAPLARRAGAQGQGVETPEEQTRAHIPGQAQQQANTWTESQGAFGGPNNRATGNVRILSEVLTVRGAAAFLSSAFIVITYSRLPELLAFITKSYVPLAILAAAVISVCFFFHLNALVATVRSRLGILLLIYTGWLAVSIVTSVWRGGSFQMFRESWLRSLFDFFAIAALTVSAKQVRRNAFMIVVAVALIAFAGLWISSNLEGRFSIAQGSLGNANDFAVHTLLALPLCFYFLFEKKPMLWRAVSLVTVGWILYRSLQTGSRTGLLMMVIMFLLATLGMVRMGAANRLKLLSAFVLAGLIGIVAMPASLRARYGTLFSSEMTIEDWQSVASAQESAESRRALMAYSVQVAAANPIFGVGMGNFVIAANAASKDNHGRELWHQAHNVYGQIASETGIPGLLLYLTILGTSFATCWRAHRVRSTHPDISQLSDLAGWLCVSQACYAFSSFFGTSTYGFYVPLFAAFSLAIDRAIKQIQERTPVAPQAFHPEALNPVTGGPQFWPNAGPLPAQMRAR